MKLRYWIRRLRGLCTNPQVAQLAANDKLHKLGVLESMAEVLETMRDKNWWNYVEDRLNKVWRVAHRAVCFRPPLTHFLVLFLQRSRGRRLWHS